MELGVGVQGAAFLRATSREESDRAPVLLAVERPALRGVAEWEKMGRMVMYWGRGNNSHVPSTSPLDWDVGQWG